ncbi:MAG: histidinol-phosphate transaminase [Ruminococcus sp.]|nr:histidinol-phosphate transaminase [Ruminococcus sp.]
MSRFFSEKYSNLEAYTPGEQPKDMKYVKLNTNESPFPPSPKALAYAAEAAKRLQLYCDPECTALTREFAKLYGIKSDEVLFTNGSDDALNFCFMAFCDDDHPAAFPDITYGFYPVFAELNHVPYEEIVLNDDFTIDVDDYCGINKTIFIANPNAPTGIALNLSDIERIVKSNPDNVVIVDEAYVDFGAESAVGLIKQYDNLLVTQTFSKSRSLAGGRLGMAIGDASLIRDLNTIKYSTNPYNINTMTQAAGTGTILDDAYSRKNCAIIAENRAYLTEKLEKLGFVHTPSTANFVFVKHPNYDGEKLYLELKKRGVLIRHFTKERIRDYNRITVGTREQLDILLTHIVQLLEETA